MKKTDSPQSQQPLECVRLLGVTIHRLTARQLLDRITQAGAGVDKTIIANVNVQAMNLAYETAWFRAFLNQANLVFCDGFGVILGTKLAGLSIEASNRSTCPDWIEDLARRCTQKQLSLFLLAGKPGVSEQAATKLKCSVPGLMIDCHHGYFEKTGSENQMVIEKINHFQPDLLFVGFGMPVQERWIQENIDSIDAKVFLPLGACLDFYTGQVYRGPQWLNDHGLEWVSRLITNPRRLWRRYLFGNPIFLWRVLKQRLGIPGYE